MVRGAFNEFDGLQDPYDGIAVIYVCKYQRFKHMCDGCERNGNAKKRLAAAKYRFNETDADGGIENRKTLANVLDRG